AGRVVRDQVELPIGSLPRHEDDRVVRRCGLTEDELGWQRRAAFPHDLSGPGGRAQSTDVGVRHTGRHEPRQAPVRVADHVEVTWLARQRADTEAAGDDDDGVQLTRTDELARLLLRV